MTTTNKTVYAAHAQDAIHYALAAAGGSFAGLESAFLGRSYDETQVGAFYRDAVKYARRAGLRVPACFAHAGRSRAETIERAQWFVGWIDRECQLAGVAAYYGETVEHMVADRLSHARLYGVATREDVLRREFPHVL